MDFLQIERKRCKVTSGTFNKTTTKTSIDLYQEGNFWRERERERKRRIRPLKKCCGNYGRDPSTKKCL